MVCDCYTRGQRSGTSCDIRARISKTLNDKESIVKLVSDFGALSEKEPAVLDVDVALGPPGPIDVASSGHEALDLRRTLLLFFVRSVQATDGRGLGVAPAQEVVDVSTRPLHTDAIHHEVVREPCGGDLGATR